MLWQYPTRFSIIWSISPPFSHLLCLCFFPYSQASMPLSLLVLSTCLYLPQCLCTAASSAWNAFLWGILQGSLPQSLQSLLRHLPKEFPLVFPKRDSWPWPTTLSNFLTQFHFLPRHLSFLVTSYLSICSWLASPRSGCKPMRKKLFFYPLLHWYQKYWYRLVCWKSLLNIWGLHE